MRFKKKELRDSFMQALEHNNFEIAQILIEHGALLDRNKKYYSVYGVRVDVDEYFKRMLGWTLGYKDNEHAERLRKAIDFLNTHV
jgi:hypothetical protein